MIQQIVRSNLEQHRQIIVPRKNLLKKKKMIHGKEWHVLAGHLSIYGRIWQSNGNVLRNGGKIIKHRSMSITLRSIKPYARLMNPSSATVGAFISLRVATHTF